MYEDFDPFAHPQRVEISVGRVESMADDEPDEVVSVVLDGVLKAVLGGPSLATKGASRSSKLLGRQRPQR